MSASGTPNWSRQLDMLEELDEVEQDVAHRAARLYRFNEAKYVKATEQGFNFEI